MTSSSFKDLFAEETSSGDIAIFTPAMKLNDKKCKKDCDDLDDELSETAPGQIGRTGNADAIAHIEANPELIKRFKKIIKELGGLTATRTLMMQLNSKGVI